MMKENWVYCRGDIYCANLDPVVGSEQGGIRPVIVIQNDTGNKHAPTLIVGHFFSCSIARLTDKAFSIATISRGVTLPK